MARATPRAWALFQPRLPVPWSPSPSAIRVRLKPTPQAFQLQIRFRLYNTTAKLYDYPKEGVFQPNSPRPWPSQSPPTQPLTYIPTNVDSPHLQHQSSPHYTPPPPPEPTETFNFISILSLTARVTIFYFTLIWAYESLTSLLASLPSTPGSAEDHEKLQLLAEEYDGLPLVRGLRALSEDDGTPCWREYVAYRGLSDPSSTSASLERRETTLGTGPLKGSRGLAAQSVFVHEESGQVMTIVNFGEGTCGWPGVVHGGAISTVFDEALGRAAAIAVQRSNNGKRSAVVTANLAVNFFEKCRPGEWYVIFAKVDWHANPGDRSQEEAHAGPRAPTTFVTPAVEAPSVGTPGAGPNTAIKGQATESGERKRFMHGGLFCVSEFGPTLEDWDRFMQPRGEDPELDLELDQLVHIHAHGKGLWVVREDVGSLPEEY